MVSMVPDKDKIFSSLLKKFHSVIIWADNFIIVSAIGGFSNEDCAIARSAWHDANLSGRMSDEDYSFEVMHSLASKANQQDLTSA